MGLDALAGVDHEHFSSHSAMWLLPNFCMPLPVAIIVLGAFLWPGLSLSDMQVQLLMYDGQ